MAAPTTTTPAVAAPPSDSVTLKKEDYEKMQQEHKMLLDREADRQAAEKLAAEKQPADKAAAAPAPAGTTAAAAPPTEFERYMQDKLDQESRKRQREVEEDSIDVLAAIQEVFSRPSKRQKPAVENFVQSIEAGKSKPLQNWPLYHTISVAHKQKVEAVKERDKYKQTATELENQYKKAEEEKQELRRQLAAEKMRADEQYKVRTRENESLSRQAQYAPSGTYRTTTTAATVATTNNFIPTTRTEAPVAGVDVKVHNMGHFDPNQVMQQNKALGLTPKSNALQFSKDKSDVDFIDQFFTVANSYKDAMKSYGMERVNYQGVAGHNYQKQIIELPDPARYANEPFTVQSAKKMAL